MPTSPEPRPRPDHLWRNSRLEDQEFSLAERLFRRCRPDHVLDGKLQAAALKLPDISVTREKHGGLPGDARWMTRAELRPDEQLAVYDDWYVVSFRVADIPNSITAPNQGKTYSILPRHVPYDDLYPHTEIWTLNEGVHVVKENRFPPVVKSQLRHVLAEKATVVLTPEELAL